MTSASHDDIRAALPDYALGMLTPADRATLQKHVVECAVCQAELAQLRTVIAGIGATTPETPPPGLRTRVLEGVTVIRPEPRTGTAPPTRDARGRPWMALALAASLLFGVLAAGYAWSLRSQLASARQQAAEAADYVARLRQELVATRRSSADLARVMQILNSPTLLRVDLKGQTAGSAAVGRAFWSSTSGVFFSAEGLPPLDAGRVYQLWTIRGTTATSAGTMTPDRNGRILHAASTASDAPDALGVTVEPAGGSTAPTLPVVMLGRPN
jgi:anti-sigma-K factor RskA